MGRAFRKDTQDDGVSMVIKERLSIEQIIAIKPFVADFAVCEFRVAEINDLDGVWVTPDHDEAFGDAHVLVMGITKSKKDALHEIACRNIVKWPGPPRVDDRPPAAGPQYDR